MYNTIITKPARKNLSRLSNAEYLRIRAKLKLLADDPRPRGCKKIESQKDRFRIRTGDFRVLYSINDEKKEVIIYRIAHRKESY
ncbi:MAG: type II toxin-antitoxin system RelE/ParE family toxin [candidate division Zixibacteria bacterium]|nr:type II toxin-antitoxin system RelE/ParE family toxin [Candidatus Tariuqbacter arcticus]